MKIVDTPAPKRGGPRFPLADLKVGQCLIVGPEEATANAVRSAALYYKSQRHGWTFTTQKNPDGGISLWRLT